MPPRPSTTNSNAKAPTCCGCFPSLTKPRQQPAWNESGAPPIRNPTTAATSDTTGRPGGSGGNSHNHQRAFPPPPPPVAGAGPNQPTIEQLWGAAALAKNGMRLPGQAHGPAAAAGAGVGGRGELVRAAQRRTSSGEFGERDRPR